MKILITALLLLTAAPDPEIRVGIMEVLMFGIVADKRCESLSIDDQAAGELLDQFNIDHTYARSKHRAVLRASIKAEGQYQLRGHRQFCQNMDMSLGPDSDAPLLKRIKP